jgi:peptidoglycan/LPS O-acetylase OafA/YrhL
MGRVRGPWLAEGVGADRDSRRTLPPLLLAGTAVTIAVAACSYRFVEQPVPVRKAPTLTPARPRDAVAAPDAPRGARRPGQAWESVAISRRPASVIEPDSDG